MQFMGNFEEDMNIIVPVSLTDLGGGGGWEGEEGRGEEWGGGRGRRERGGEREEGGER